MKKLFIFAVVLLVGLGSCKKDETVTADTAADAKTAIEAKHKAIGWDKAGHAPFQGGGAIKTQGGNGYVQYYAFGSLKTAIYYYPGRGAFAMFSEETTAYDKIGQDKFAFVVSDPKPTLSGLCGYNDITTTDGGEGIITCGAVFYGGIYKKYKEVNRWDGPLGPPTSGILNTPANATDKGTFATFKTGGIWNTPTIGTQAIWGKAYKMWVAVDWERSWLKYLITSCDPNKADNLQSVEFQNGSIKTGPICPAYFNKNNETVFKNGTRAANVSSIPCY